MPRYFAELCYKGTNYSGWQRQDNALTVQECMEDQLSKLLRSTIQVVGCGRTDAGVHASQYYLHFDFEGTLPDRMPGRLNMMLPPDIGIKDVFPVNETAHARFDARRRSYKYTVIRNKSPFHREFAYRYYRFDKIDPNLLNEAAELLLKYDQFYPFCKAHSDVKTMECMLLESRWEILPNKMEFFISANRFLRGMVRLIVGMCLRVGSGDLELGTIKEAMDQQIRLERAWSVPAQGLFLTGVSYPADLLALAHKS